MRALAWQKKYKKMFLEMPFKIVCRKLFSLCLLVIVDLIKINVEIILITIKDLIKFVEKKSLKITIRVN